MKQRLDVLGLATIAATLAGTAALAGCGEGGAASPDAAPACSLVLEFAEGGDGHAQPVGASAGEARAGRIAAAQLPEVRSGLAVWAAGDFILANDRVAMVIEDVGPSDLYDPWGGRPVGIARVEAGALVEPADFGEFFVLTNRESLVTTSVSVLADGADGSAAVVRAVGRTAPTPFFENIVGGLFREEHGDVLTAIDYVLEPDADFVDIFVTHRSPRLVRSEVPTQLHGYMYTPRTPTFAPGVGFATESETVPYLGFITSGATSYAYSRLDGDLRPGISESGFTSNFSEGFTIAPCAETRRHHARITIGGPDVDGLVQAVARMRSEALTAVFGTVVDPAGAAVAGARVHAESQAGAYLTRAATGADGSFTLHVPAGEAARLTAWRRGDAVVGPIALAPGQTTVMLALPPAGTVHVVAVDADTDAALPARVQVLPKSTPLPSVPGQFGEPGEIGGRLHVDYAISGESTLRVPAGEWEVIVSRGYEYEIHREVVEVAAGATTEIVAPLAHVVDTTGQLCADYHIHTHRSADAGDDARLKVAAAVADGLEIPIRSEHEFVEDFQPVVEAMGLQAWAFGVTSVELTSMEVWGHFGVLPLAADPSRVNGGTPLWQRFPSADDPDVRVETLSPPEVFAQVRARPERPVLIVNHPRGGFNYFDYVGYDPVTGMVDDAEAWDEDFTVVEVFNDGSWRQNRSRNVADWLSLLDHGRRVFAVGSSDSHGVAQSPVGYPRTCLRLGTDDPRNLTPNQVRDATAAGRAIISGGIYIDAAVGDAGPGDDAVGTGPTALVSVRVQAASWISVDAIDIVVDGVTVDTITVTPEDADPTHPAVRYQAEIPVDVAATGSYVIIAASGDEALDPVHPGRMPFGVTNPIFLAR
jgi:hypothetical protein